MCIDGYFGAQPRMVCYLVDADAFVRVDLQHAPDKISGEWIDILGHGVDSFCVEGWVRSILR